MTRRFYMRDDVPRVIFDNGDHNEDTAPRNLIKHRAIDLVNENHQQYLVDMLETLNAVRDESEDRIKELEDQVSELEEDAEDRDLRIAELEDQAND